MSFTEQQDSDSIPEAQLHDGVTENLSEELSESSDFVVAAPKKAALNRTTLIVLGILALAGGVVWTMYQRAGGPKQAAAAQAESNRAKKTINAFLDGGSSNIHNMEKMLRSTEKVVQQFLAYPSMTQVPLSDLHTNPFRMKTQRPLDPSADNIVERRRREEERVAMLKAVQSLHLQSIMYSDARKACMINDRMYREGQTVDAFAIERITATSVIVKSSVYRFELKMQR